MSSAAVVIGALRVNNYDSCFGNEKISCRGSLLRFAIVVDKLLKYELLGFGESGHKFTDFTLCVRSVSE